MNALAACATEPDLALVACFFAGSAAGATSTLVVLTLAWAALRYLRSTRPSPPLRSSRLLRPTQESPRR